MGTVLRADKESRWRVPFPIPNPSTATPTLAMIPSTSSLPWACSSISKLTQPAKMVAVGAAGGRVPGSATTLGAPGARPNTPAIMLMASRQTPALPRGCCALELELLSPAPTAAALAGGKSGALFGRGANAFFNSGSIRFGWGWSGTAIGGRNIIRLAIGHRPGSIHIPFLRIPRFTMK